MDAQGEGIVIAAPQSTVEHPLTAIDYIALLSQCETLEEVDTYSLQLPLHVLNDERYSKAVAFRKSVLRATA